MQAKYLSPLPSEFDGKCSCFEEADMRSSQLHLVMISLWETTHMHTKESPTPDKFPIMYAIDM